VPLSEHEQRLLEQIEQALAAEDPKFVSTVQSTDLRSVARRRMRLAAVLFVIGLVVFVTGAVYHRMVFGILPIMSLIGFCAMLGSAVYGWSQYKRSTGAELHVVDGVSHRPGKAPARTHHVSILQRMEDRFRRRFDDRD
jgi:hypothetical protein